MGGRVRKAWGDGRISEERIAELRLLADRPDEAIDYSDVPQVTEEFWQRAIPNPFYKPVKKQVTVRIDADVLAWLRQGKDGYQTRLNAALREAMLVDLEEKRRRA